MDQTEEQVPSTGAETGGAPASGRGRVDALLLKPLELRGLRKQTRQSVEEHREMKARLRRSLAYLDQKWFGPLGEMIMVRAVGKDKNQWPDEVTVMNLARNLELPPGEHSELVRTYMASKAGVSAWNSSEFMAAALFWWLRRHGAPRRETKTSPGSWPSIAAKAEELKAKHARYADWIQNGKAGREERAWMARWKDHIALIEHLVHPRVEEDAA